MAPLGFINEVAGLITKQMTKKLYVAVKYVGLHCTCSKQINACINDSGISIISFFLWGGERRGVVIGPGMVQK